MQNLIRGPFDNALVINIGEDQSLHQMVTFMYKKDGLFSYRFDVWMENLRNAPTSDNPIRSIGSWRVHGTTMNGTLKYDESIQYPDEAGRAEMAVIEVLEREKAIDPQPDVVKRLLSRCPIPTKSYRTLMGHYCPWTGEINEAVEQQKALRFCLVEGLVKWDDKANRIVRTKIPYNG